MPIRLEQWRAGVSPAVLGRHARALRDLAERDARRVQAGRLLSEAQMDAALSIEETFQRERGRLRNFIRRRVSDVRDAEDILQDVFYELVDATTPIEQVTAWLFRVASNRIIDLFRKQKHQTLTLDDLLPSPEAGPEAAYAHSVLIDEIEAALDELPKEQRDVFIGHEIEGRSFKEMSEATGVRVNTLLSRKHYAVLHLRRRLQEIYEEFR